MYRIGRHFNDLVANVHEIEDLQADWNLYGRQSFRFRAVVSGPNWEAKSARIRKEVECITQCSHSVYNKDPLQTSQNVRKEWTYKGVTYASGAEAARKLNVSASTIYRLMKKEGEPLVIRGSKPVSIDGEIFPSVTDTVNRLGIAKSTLYRRLRSSNYSTWFFVEKTRSNDYPGRE